MAKHTNAGAQAARTAPELSRKIGAERMRRAASHGNWRNEGGPKLNVSVESEGRLERRCTFSCVRADATGRWPPKGGQPEPPLATTLDQRAGLEAPAAACVSRERATSATDGRCALRMTLE